MFSSIWKDAHANLHPDNRDHRQNTVGRQINDRPVLLRVMRVSVSHLGQLGIIVTSRSGCHNNETDNKSRSDARLDLEQLLRVNFIDSKIREE